MTYSQERDEIGINFTSAVPVPITNCNVFERELVMYKNGIHPSHCTGTGIGLSFSVTTSTKYNVIEFSRSR